MRNATITICGTLATITEIMRKIITTVLLIIITVGCGDYRKTKSGYVIKGNSKIIFNGIDKSLNEQSAISGFVYSKDSKEFIEQAYVKIGTQQFVTDKNGHFNAIVEPGMYTVSTNFIGNDEEKVTNLKVEKNKRIIIFFELGTAVIVCY